MVDQTDAVEIISYADAHGISVWLDGGWGVDALLEEETRPHNDIDLFVQKEDSARFIDIIKARGFSEVVEAYTAESHTIWRDAKGRIVDLHVFEFNEQGCPVFMGETYPSNVFSGIGRIGDISVRCINAKDQVLFHLGYKHDADDVHDVRLLCERFGIPVPDEYK